MNIVTIRMTFAVALVLVLTATGLWASAAAEPAAAADKQYVTDPSTGKQVLKPQYGGTITFASMNEPTSIDPYIRYAAGVVIEGVNEKLGIANWAIDRDEWGFRTRYFPEFALTGLLAESWEQPDPTTIIFHIRKGVHWHNKAPMNGREVTADDIKYNFERILGLGSGFTEPGADVNVVNFNVESIEATDKYTVVFKLKSITLTALKEILVGTNVAILAPEVVEQYGDVTDWRNVVGTGPFELTDWVEGSSITWTKNPDYWGYDEKYPENRLPYIDELRSVISMERATHLALMRSGKADFLGPPGNSQLITVDEVVSLQRTNPEMNLWPYSYRSEKAMTFNTQIPPWNDVRVRRAIQMAIDLETINDTYFQGWADTTRAGIVGTSLIGYSTPFEDWPEELKGYYTYDPEGAEALLDEAGYPRGADGIRFQTVYDHYEWFDLDYYQIVMEYLRAIGIGVEVNTHDRSAYGALLNERKALGLLTSISNVDAQSYTASINYAYSTAGFNNGRINDPVYDAMFEAAAAATTTEEQKRLVNEADQYLIEKHWWIVGPRVPLFNVAQPWIIGYNGEVELSYVGSHLHFSRLWIDHELKEAMGF